MNYFKNRPNSDVHKSQPQPNSVTFNNAHPSGQTPIIISTQHPSQISIMTNPQLNLSDMAKSPTDSFHSVSSNFHNEKRDGRVNMAYSGSNDITPPRRHHQTHTNAQHVQNSGQNRVFHQSYWSWNWPWSNWNQREKVLLLVIVILSLCILSLTASLSVVIQKNIEYREILFTRFGINV